MDTTKELMERIRTGDLGAYRELFRQNAGTVYQNAFQATHDRDAARRITRDTFREIADKLRGAPGDGWELWLGTLAEKNAAFASLTRGEVSDIEAELFAQAQRETPAFMEEDLKMPAGSSAPAAAETSAQDDAFAAAEAPEPVWEAPAPELAAPAAEPELLEPEASEPERDPEEALRTLLARFGIADAGEPCTEADSVPGREPFAPEITPEEPAVTAFGQAEPESEPASIAEPEPEPAFAPESEPEPAYEPAARPAQAGVWSPTLRPTQPLSEIRRYAAASAEPEEAPAEAVLSRPEAEKPADDDFETLWRSLHLEDGGAEAETAADSPAPEPAAVPAEAEPEQEFAWTARASETDEERRARLREAVRREAEGEGAFGGEDAFRAHDAWDADGEPAAAPAPAGKPEKKAKKQRTRAAKPDLRPLLVNGALVAGILVLLWLALGLLHALGILPGLNLGYGFLKQLF